MAYAGIIDELRAVGKLAEEHGLTFDISAKPDLSFHFGWDCSMPGIWITFGKDGHPNSTLLALPPTGMKTTSYGPYFFGGEPPAASLLRVNERMMLFVSQDSTPPDNFIEAIQTPLEQDEEASHNLPMCLVRRRGALLDVEMNDPVCVDAPASHSRDEIIEIVFERLPYIHVIGICTSGYPEKEIVPRKKLVLPDELAPSVG